jgi:hypothetical protein
MGKAGGVGVRTTPRSFMRVYELDKCLFDYLTALEALSPSLRPNGTRWTDEEREALSNRDIGALYPLGTHPYGMGVNLQAGDGR